jgi:hypothetical protein
VSPLTPDERAEAVDDLRECASLLGERQSMPLHALADKLEAEPEPSDMPVHDAVMAARRVGLECRDKGYVGKVERERDEAREALRDLTRALNGTYVGAPVVHAMARAAAVLEGVERTHTLVPNPDCGAAGWGLRRLAEIAEAPDYLRRLPQNINIEQCRALADAFDTAARGDSVSWPTEERAS